MSDEPTGPIPLVPPVPWMNQIPPEVMEDMRAHIDREAARVLAATPKGPPS